ncbi:MAG TPA: DUF4348 domain-containing protein [Saprospiraceae bacterium]|nr:DUF4348 domain-containing protein [Saprospiraceae bacterium]MCB9328049.1 DUF4348 domain-containing protein [Lewinellaceae bacterium]HPK10216.1 DUF4348 domain-containing protein [Saprospiraceae bacterium]HPQ20596.1 DUF4348 domain-containing protein [Saprospiraceae bacterium]
MNIKSILFLALALSLLISCKQKPDQESISEEEISEYYSDDLPEDFVDFYNLFSSDSAYQIQHIVWPLSGKISDRDSLGLTKDTVWTAEAWPIHHRFDSMDNSYSQAFTNFNNIITEKISDASGFYTMMRRFGKVGGEWNLIYYKAMGPGE